LSETETNHVKIIPQNPLETSLVVEQKDEIIISYIDPTASSKTESSRDEVLQELVEENPLSLFYKAMAKENLETALYEDLPEE
jgi:hypothetical protein